MLIGSAAIKFWFSDFPREPKDIDFIKDSKINNYFNTNLKKEYLENPILLKHYFNEEVLNPDVLYTLKISHLFWDLFNNSWDKHIWDVQFLKEKKL